MLFGLILLFVQSCVFAATASVGCFMGKNFPKTLLFGNAYFKVEKSTKSKFGVFVEKDSEEEARWEAMLLDAKKFNAEGVVVAVPKSAVHVNPKIVANKCKRLARIAENHGMRCIFAMKALEEASEDGIEYNPHPNEEHALWSKGAEADSPLLQEMARACNNEKGCEGIIFHDEPVYDREPRDVSSLAASVVESITHTKIQKYRESLKTLVSKFRKINPKTNIFLKGNENDMRRIPDLATVLNNDNHVFFAAGCWIHGGNIAMDPDKVLNYKIGQGPSVEGAQGLVLIDAVGCPRTVCVSQKLRDSFHGTAIRKFLRRGWSVTVFGHKEEDKDHTLSEQDRTLISGMFAQADDLWGLDSKISRAGCTIYD